MRVNWQMTKMENMMDKEQYADKEIELYYKIFDVVIEMTTAQGGDGWGFILSDNWQQLADLFRGYDDWFKDETKAGHSISFGNNQEWITFSSPDCDTRFHDIVVSISW